MSIFKKNLVANDIVASKLYATMVKEAGILPIDTSYADTPKDRAQMVIDRMHECGVTKMMIDEFTRNLEAAITRVHGAFLLEQFLDNFADIYRDHYDKYALDDDFLDHDDEDEDDEYDFTNITTKENLITPSGWRGGFLFTLSVSPMDPVACDWYHEFKKIVKCRADPKDLVFAYPDLLRYNDMYDRVTNVQKYISAMVIDEDEVDFCRYYADAITEVTPGIINVQFHIVSVVGDQVVEDTELPVSVWLINPAEMLYSLDDMRRDPLQVITHLGNDLLRHILTTHTTLDEKDRERLFSTFTSTVKEFNIEHFHIFKHGDGDWDYGDIELSIYADAQMFLFDPEYYCPMSIDAASIYGSSLWDDAVDDDEGYDFSDLDDDDEDEEDE